MANHIVYGNGPTIFQSFGGSLFSDSLLYFSDAEFGTLNADGTFSYFFGNGLNYDASTGLLTAGTITSIHHFSSEGLPLDVLTNVNVAATYFMIFTFNPNLSYTMLDGGSVIDARDRYGNAVVDDVLQGGSGSDLIYGGSGNDTLSGWNGSDTIWGGIGNDRLLGGSEGDRLYGEAGNDVLIGDVSYIGSTNMSGDDILDAGTGNDVLWGRIGNDTLKGGKGTDTAVYFGSFASLNIAKTSTGFTISSSKDGTDVLTAVERIATNDGTYSWSNSSQKWVKISSITGVELASFAGEVFTGTLGGDTLVLTGDFTTEQANVFKLNAGNDFLSFNGPQWDEVLVLGGAGDDTILVTDGLDLTIPVAIGNFTLNGGEGSDTLKGGAFADNLLGGNGNDQINGGRGNDQLTGGAGADTFVFGPQTGSNLVFGARNNYGPGNDVITDFTVGTDKLVMNTAQDITITDTAAGLVLTADYITYQDNMGLTGRSSYSLLLLGVHGGVALGDLLA
jgi:Ca2+-binding RTX toxin-like protein